MHLPFRRLGAAAVTVASTLILASAAHAAGWQPLGAISPSGVSASTPEVAAAPDGSMWLAWTTDSKTQIERIAADGKAGPVLDLAGAPSYEIKLVVDSSGAATAAWALQSGGVNERMVQPDGTLGTTQAVGSSSATSPLAMGIDGGGIATLAYTDPDSGTSNPILWAQRLNAGAPSGSAIQISSNSNEAVEKAAIATNSAGESVLTWGYGDYTDLTFPYQWAERVRQLKADRSLGDEHDLIGTPQYGDYTASAVAIAPSGDAYLGFVQMSGNPSGGGDMKVVKLSAGDSLSSVGTFETATAVGDNYYPPHIVINSAGQVTVVWTDKDSSDDYHLVSRRIQADGTIQPPLSGDPDIVSGSDGETDLNVLTALPNGSAMAAWLVYDYPNYPLHTALIDPTSGPGPVMPINDSTSDSSETLSEAADSNGNVFLALERTPDYSSYSVHAAFYDVQGPTVDNLAVPNAGAPGDTLVFGESAIDRSGVHAYSWDFGDGGTGTGSIVTHSYAASGTYTITATATDEVGNTTTKTKQVVVRAPTSGGGSSLPQSGSLKAQLAGLHAAVHIGRGRTLTLHLPAQPVDAFGTVLVRAGAGHAARLVTLARRQFPVFHGKPVRLRVKLSRQTVKLARRHHGRLRASVRLALTGFNGNSAAHTYRFTIRTGR
ncbi:MAG TPA: PKD domain-containing protein [Thermoleophilaceae bacterium]